MKFSVTMKDPDGVYDSLRDAVMRDVGDIEGLSAEERDVMYSMRMESVKKLLNKWFSCGEYLTVAIDTEADTCVVMEQQ